MGLFPAAPPLASRQRTFVHPKEAIESALKSDVPTARRSALELITTTSKHAVLSIAEVDRVGELVRDEDAAVRAAATKVARELVVQLAHADDAEKRCAAARLTTCLPQVPAATK